MKADWKKIADKGNPKTSAWYMVYRAENDTMSFVYWHADAKIWGNGTDTLISHWDDRPETPED